MIAYARVVLRSMRLELRLVGIAAVAVCALSVYFAILMRATGIETCLTTLDQSTHCADASRAWSGLAFPAMLVRVAAAASAGMTGLLIGVMVAAPEIERRTALIAWTLAPSRWRWYSSRAAIAGGAVVLIALAMAFSTDYLEAATQPTTPLAASLLDYQSRGLLLVAYAVLAYASALASGAVAGRTLPGFIVAAAAVAVLIALLTIGGDAQLKTGAVVLDPADTGALVAGYPYRDSETGDIVSAEAAWALLPPDDPQFAARFAPLVVGVPGRESRQVIGSLLGVSAVLAGGLAVLGGLAVARRRIA